MQVEKYECSFIPCQPRIFSGQSVCVALPFLSPEMEKERRRRRRRRYEAGEDRQGHNIILSQTHLLQTVVRVNKELLETETGRQVMGGPGRPVREGPGADRRWEDQADR